MENNVSEVKGKFIELFAISPLLQLKKRSKRFVRLFYNYSDSCKYLKSFPRKLLYLQIKLLIDPSSITIS